MQPPSIEINFFQMFMLVNGRATGGHHGPGGASEKRRPHEIARAGGVVLIPSKGHIAFLVVDNSSPFVLMRCQVDLMVTRGGRPATRTWGLDTYPPQNEDLVSAEKIFQRPVSLSSTHLVSDPMVPESLHARVVLGGGRFSARASCSTLWTFPSPTPKPFEPQVLADTLTFVPDAQEGDVFALRIRSHRGEERTVDLGPQSTVYFLNFDNRGMLMARVPPAGHYELTEYDDLHQFLALEPGENRHPHGDFQLGDRPRSGETMFNLATDPVCGGETSTPDPPVDPPDPAPGIATQLYAFHVPSRRG